VFAGSAVQFAAGIVFSGLIAFAAYRDVRTRRIPNRVVVILAVAGLGYSLLLSGVSGLLRSGSGIGVGLACWLPFYALGWLGAGDVKLFAAAGSWLGPLRTVEGALIAALAGAVLALGWMLWAYGFKRTASTLSVASVAPAILAPGGDTDRGRTLPYGVALAVGALAAGWLPWSLLFG
jgi:prepilin peptidase CpaA